MTVAHRRLSLGVLTLSILALSACREDEPSTADVDASVPAPTDAQASDASGDPRCTEDADCDDALYCNGAERCDPAHPSAGADGCVAGVDPCAGTRCDDDLDECVCDVPDAD